MVLTARGTRVLSAERGSQVLEFALVLPLLAAAAGMVLHVGVLAADAVAVHAVAAQAARAAAVEGPQAAHRLVSEATGGRGHAVVRSTGDGWTTVEVRLPTRAFGRLGRGLRLAATGVGRRW